jgi:putative sterol carrier protein
MTTASEKMNQAALAIAKNAAAASAVDAVYKFVLDGEGGGTWMVSLKGAPTITAGDGEAECTIRMAASDYVDMIEGRSPGQDLFFAGKLQIEGDMGLAMKLQALTELMA